MSQKKNFTSKPIEDLKTWIAAHPEYDWLHQEWKTEFLSEEEQPLRSLLKAYQRLVRIIPQEHHQLAFALLARDFHSAVQIATLPKRQFLELTHDLVPPEVLETIYAHAQIKRGQLVVQYMNILQNNEPHAKAARI